MKIGFSLADLACVCLRQRCFAAASAAFDDTPADHGEEVAAAAVLVSVAVGYFFAVHCAAFVLRCTLLYVGFNTVMVSNEAGSQHIHLIWVPFPEPLCNFCASCPMRT